ncbi:MAG: protein phosphatase 2C domain-containing protein, partial [Bacteroidota bacterium]
AVMDGCSMGKESHFASNLIAKLLRKIAKEFAYLEFVQKKQAPAFLLLEDIMQRLFLELRQLKHKLDLGREEMLSTLILGILDVKEQALELIAVGDGLVCVNAQLIEFEQDDRPDYLGYHLEEEFEDWFQNQTQRLSCENVEDLSIATDGIFTFKPFNNKKYLKISEVDLVEYFLVDEQWLNHERMLQKKFLNIEQKFGLKPSDDLTIIRLKLDKKQF